LTAIALDRYWVICLAPPNRSATQMHTSKQVGNFFALEKGHYSLHAQFI